MTQHDDHPPALLVREWAVVFLTAALMAGLIVMTRCSPSHSHIAWESPHYLHPQEITVTITGAVQRPGSYTLSRTSKVGDLLAAAEPAPEANLKRLRAASRLKDGQAVHVPAAPMITVHLEGAVEAPVSIQVPKGTTRQQLVRKVRLQDGANLKPLLSKRLLKDEETIHIPMEGQTVEIFSEAERKML